ncbi:aspartic peptidase domain-containing protein [Apiospora arundinis]
MRTSPAIVAIFLAASQARQGVSQAFIPAADSPDHQHRRANVAGSTANELSLRLNGPNLTYTTEFGIGTPPQKVELRVRLVELERDDPSTSSSSEGKEKFQTQDAKGMLVDGQYFTDTWQVGNAKVRNVAFAANPTTTRDGAIAGLGGIKNTDNTSYASLTSAFALAGLATTSAFSVWLSDLAGKSGSLIFGGIDTQKFRGTLTRLKTYPLQLDQTKDGRLGVQLSTVLAVSVTGTDALAYGTRPLLLEIFLGSSQIYLPGDLVEAIYREVGATEDPTRKGAATIPCRMGKSPAYFSFMFSGSAIDGSATGPMINISMSALVLPNDLKLGSISTDMFDNPQSQTCQFVIVKGRTSFGLGEAFIRSAYVVFDQENGEIGIAQSNPTPSGSYMIRFPSKGALIPLATPAAQPTGSFPTSVVTSPVTPLETYSAAEGFQKYETARPPPKDSNTTTTANSPNPNGLKIGLCIGFSGGAMAVFTGFMAYWRIVLNKPIPILSRYSKKRWINPHATELEVKHPQPDAAEVVGFPWAFDRPVGWNELDAPVHPVELEGDYCFHGCGRPLGREGTMSSTAVDTEESRSAVAARESMIVPGDISVATSPVEGDGYLASPLRLSFIPGPDILDIGVLGNHSGNTNTSTKPMPNSNRL